MGSSTGVRHEKQTAENQDNKQPLRNKQWGKGDRPTRQ